MTKEEIKSQIEQDILQAYREIIKSNNLVDTGALLSSAEIEIDLDSNIRLIAENYYKFLDDGTKYINPYDLTTQIINHPLFEKAENLLEDYLLLLIEEQLFPNE